MIVIFHGVCLSVTLRDARITDIDKYRGIHKTPWYSRLVCQGCSLGLERLGLEAVSRRFWNVSYRLVSRVWKNRTSRSRLGLEDITSRSWVSGFVTLVL